jgi:hypothetical protein
MQILSKPSPDLWAEARRLRADGATYARIAARLGMSVHTLGQRARREGWSSSATTPSTAMRRGKVGSASPGTAGIRSRLAQRLYKVIEFRIRMMEMRMEKQLQICEQDPDAAVAPAHTKDERDSFAALIDSINQVTEMASEPAPAADGRRRTATGAVNPELTALSDDIDPDGLAAASEKDQFRRELAEHLGRMFPKP